METIKTVKLSTGKSVEISYSESESPREWDNLGTVVAIGGYSHLNDNNKHSINLNDEHGYSGRWDFIERGADKVRKQANGEVAVILAIHVYKHTGVALSTSMEYPFNCRWDSGTCGFIYATKEDIRKNFGIKRVTQKYLDRTEEILKAEIETLSKWVNGDVYAFFVEDENGKFIDSCGGFFGYDPEKNGMTDHLTSTLSEKELEEFLEKW